MLRRFVVVAEPCWILVVAVQAGAVADVRVDIRIGGKPCVGDGRGTGLTPPVPAKRFLLGASDHLESNGRL